MGKNKPLTAALLIIGNEILSGRTQDKHIAWLAPRLNERGVTLSEVRVIPDIEEKIIRTIQELKDQADYVFTTGGIGPTHDDITAESMAKAFGVKLVINEKALTILKIQYGTEQLTSPRLKMAMIPEGASLIPNPVSGAPGFSMGNIYVLAGVPNIMQGMADHVLATIKGGAAILSRTVTANTRESLIAEALNDIQNQWENIEIGSYPGYTEGKFQVSVVLRGTDEKALEEASRAVEEVMAKITGDNNYCHL